MIEEKAKESPKELQEKSPKELRKELQKKAMEILEDETDEAKKTAVNLFVRNCINELNKLCENRNLIAEKYKENSATIVPDAEDFLGLCYYKLIDCYKRTFTVDFIDECIKKTLIAMQCELTQIGVGKSKAICGAKNLKATLEVILESYSDTSEKSPNAFILAMIVASLRKGVISYDCLDKELPLIQDWGVVEKNDLHSVVFKFSEIEHKINWREGTVNTYIERMFLEDKVIALIFLEKVVGLDFFKGYPNHIAQAITKAKENTEVASNIVALAKSFAYDLKNGVNSRSRMLIHPDTTIEELQRDWQITCSDDLYGEYNDKKIFFNAELESLLYLTIHSNAELGLIQSECGDSDMLKEFLKQLLKISVVKNDAELGGEKGNLEFKIAVPDEIYKAVRESVDCKFDSIFIDEKYNTKADIYEFTKADIIYSFGKWFEENGEWSGKSAISSEAKFFEAVKRAKLIRKHEKQYIFYNEYEKHIILGEYYALKCGEQLYRGPNKVSTMDVKTICEKMCEKIMYSIERIGTDDNALDEKVTTKYDHLKFNPVASVFFALSFLEKCDRYVRDVMLGALCQYASNYDSKYRKEQEVSVKIISYYLMYCGNEIPFELKRKMFTVAYEKQLYRFQIPLYREMVKKDLFFEKYPRNVFEKALEMPKTTSQDSSAMSRPGFYLLQGLANNGSQGNDFLANSIKLQDMVWIDRLNEKNECVKEMVKTQLLSITAEANRRKSLDYSNTAIISNNICFISFADLADYGRRPIQWLFENIGVQDTLAVQDTLGDDLLLAAVYTDYYQRSRNTVYNDHVKNKNSGKEEPGDDILLICGAFRLINAYDFSGEKISLSEDMIKAYWEYLKFEGVDTRYFYFLLRLLSYVFDANNERIFNIKSVCEEKGIEQSALEKAFSQVHFLSYDNMPMSFEEFLNEIYG